MSRTSLHRLRRRRAVWDRPATGTRLLPTPFLPTILHLNYHYKRCPKALRLRLCSDQSPSRPLHGRSPDKSRHTLSKGYCQVRAPLIRRIRLAPSGDAQEHGVMSLPRAIAPSSDSPGLDLAGQSEQSYERRLKTNAPFLDSTVVTTGELRSTNAGHGSPLPSLGMVEHFWWSRLPHSETSSRLLHILSEVRGCRRAVADVERPLGRTPRIGTGVDAFSRKRPGPSTPSTLPLPFRGSARNLGLAHSPISALSTPSPRGACPPEADHFQLASDCKRTNRLGTVHLWRSVKPSPDVEPLILSPVEGSSGGRPTTANSSHPSPTTHERTPPTTPYPHNLPCPIQRKRGISAKQSKIVPESAHQSKLPPTSAPAPTSPSIPNTEPKPCAMRRPASTEPWKAAGHR